MKLVGSKEAVRTPEFHKERQLEKKIKIFLLTLLAVGVVAAPVVVLRLKALEIENVKVAGNKVTKNEDIQSIVSQDLAGEYLRLLPKSNALLYPHKKIETDLLSAIPRLASAEVSLEGSKALSVQVTERTPYALYCEGEKCYFLDETGYIFSEAPAFSGGVYMIYKSDPPLENPLRSAIMEPDTFRNTNRFLKNLPNINIKPKALTIKNDDYYLATLNGLELRWKESQDVDAMFSNLYSFVNALKPSELKNLLYIDLRFNSKIRYSFKNE